MAPLRWRASFFIGGTPENNHICKEHILLNRPVTMHVLVPTSLPKLHEIILKFTKCKNTLIF
jgi:hypothetical protein